MELARTTCKAKASPAIGSRRMGMGGAGNGNREQENGSGSGPEAEREWSGGASGDKLTERRLPGSLLTHSLMD